MGGEYQPLLSADPSFRSFSCKIYDKKKKGLIFISPLVVDPGLEPESPP